MSKRNVRIAIRDTTDSHNVGFFDNKSGIKYNSANLTQFLKGACSVLVLTYHSKKMIAQSGQKLAFRFKDKDFWLNINSVKKTGYKIELTAYSLSLEANKEKRGPHKPANAMTIKQYIDYYDPEHSFEIGINEVADKSIKLEWSGTDTILARLYSVANSFGAELEFVTELNDDYSLKRHVVNIYREGNLGKDKTGMPVRVGEKLKVINYSDNMDDFYTGIRRTGKDGLTIAGLNKKIYDDKGNLLFYSSGDTLYAPQARDKYPSIARKTNDGYIINEDSETEHTSKEALFGYMLSELKKHCELKVDYEVEGAVDGSIGDRKTLIDARHFDPPLYVQARISEQTEALLETSDVKTTLSNYVRKSSQIANELLQRVEQLTLEATPYTIKLATNNGIVFKNNRGQSTIYPSLKRGQKPVECTWKWLVDNQGFGTSPTFEVQAAGMSSKLVLTAIALIDGKEVAREQVTFTNVNDGAKGSDGKSITVAKAEKQTDGVKVTFSDNKSIVVPKGDKGDKGDPADPVPLNALQEEMKQTKQGLSDVKTDLLKEKAESSANIERVKKEVGAISSQQTAYEQSNTENLARITGQLGDKASKSEIKQTADGIREEMSQLSKNADEKISAAKTTFEKTAEGLKTDMVAVKSYVANDGKRREELEQYSREETAKQIASERSAVAQNYVGKSQYTEDVKGVNRRFEELRTGTSNLLLNTEFKTLADVNNVNGATLKLNQNDYNSHNSIEVTVTGQNKNVWKGITLNASVSAFKKGDTIAVRMPIYIFSDVPINAGLTLVLKNRSKNIAYVFKGLGGLPRNKWHIVEFLHTFNSDTNFEGVNFFYLYATQNGHYKIAEPSLTLSNVIPSSWAPAVEDSKNYTDTKLAEYKQGVDGQLAAVKQEVGSKVTQATFDQRANQITQSVQELNNNTVKKNQIKIDENGLVSSSEKIVNGQTLASMISQNPEWVEIIAKLLKIKADMIVNGAVTADKLNVEKLSALTSDLGKVTAGLIDLRKHWVRTSTDDVWGIINDVTYDTSTLLSDDGILTNGRPGRNKKSDVKPTIMPLVWLNSGQLFFANVDSEYDIIQMLLNGVYPFVRGNTAQIRFGKLEDEREALFIDCQFAELYLKANNYTDWKQSTFNSGVRWKVQGNLILVDYDVTFNKDGNQAICGVPQEYVAGARMFVVKAWSLNKDKDRTAQLNADGSLHILGAEKGMNYRGQIIWAY
ncbi:phage tail protein [Streptococcus anginosus]|uniref:phage tail protein n=1 Tax=Streptococcus anginosus TaxID=1328 RepID=UPI0018AAB65A|nr:phage tail protein [Streptococcus anginosus]MDB8648113.1 phage tail protein [Streptococcus anginosus]